jgi:hypothetical protein
LAGLSAALSSSGNAGNGYTRGSFHEAKLSRRNRRFAAPSYTTRDGLLAPDLRRRVDDLNGSRGQSRQERKAKLHERCYRQANIDTAVHNAPCGVMYKKPFNRRLRRAMGRDMAARSRVAIA